ncbi:MAG: class B sortase, partial [Clostridia bacterium]|nr:class B sortase [Clostridia bacterium]
MKKIWKTNLLILLCLSFLLTGCSATSLTAVEAVPLATADQGVPPVLNTTKKFAGKTLYEYYSENEDTIGWLKINGIKTDHVVMLGQTNKEYERGADGQNHYLDSNFNHQSSSYGELYMDHRCRVTHNYMSQNMTVYGHHMKDGTMLAGLDHYKRKSFYEEHPYITLDTLWGTYHFRVFGVYTVNLKVAKDAAFDYRQPDYKSEEAFL